MKLVLVLLMETASIGCFLKEKKRNNKRQEKDRRKNKMICTGWCSEVHEPISFKLGTIVLIISFCCLIPGFNLNLYSMSQGLNEAKTLSLFPFKQNSRLSGWK